MRIRTWIGCGCGVVSYLTWMLVLPIFYVGSHGNIGTGGWVATGVTLVTAILGLILLEDQSSWPKKGV